MGSITITLLLMTLLGVTAEKYIVDDKNGDDNNSGLDVSYAFKTIQHCVDHLQNPGDECHVRTGRYHEVININGLRGSAENPIIIKGYNDERPIWDGTVQIKRLGWYYDSVTGICSTDMDQDITALFLDDDLLTAARWPNALWSDKTIFNNSFFGHCAKSSLFGNIIDDGTGEGTGLAGSGINATGAMAILNIGSWETFVRPVLHHERGSANFTYNHDMDHNIAWKPAYNQYYLEASLELLDVQGEWFFDHTSKKLYLIPPFDGCPAVNADILRGRTIDYGLTVTNTTGLIIANMTFFASNIHAYSHNINSLIDNIQLDSLHFKFPSSSHRMLSNIDYPLITSLDASAWSHGVLHYGKLMITNCTFEGSEGSALVYKGKECYVHNNIFMFNEWSGQTNSSGGGGTVIDKGFNNEFSQNTLMNNGNSAGFRGSLGADIKYNNIFGQCAGKIMNDGAGIQVADYLVNNTKISHNWVHDAPPKHGIRFDTPEPSNGHLGHGGYIGYNVVWNVLTINVKGDDHVVENNFAFDNEESNGLCNLCVYYRVRTDPTIENNNTVVLNNGATQADGGRDLDTGENWPLAGAVVENNFSGEDIKHHMVNPPILDFRPKKGSVLDQENVIGPYKPNLESSFYYIPGRKLYKTSSPIPPDGAVESTKRDAVIFLGGYMAEVHHFYFGTDYELVSNASLSEEEFQYSLSSDEGNMFILPDLKGNTQYYWRIDAKRGGYLFKGDTWSLNTMST
ncbi:unnamed protein product [Meganyctiphanes norvegica]|uniref:Right handed beta helix domain-containing protein n=1 Tax=Meganyctiphanes norvegica TaxID=48144 RepID=A0AAV2Q7C2_MEGNR